MACCCSADVASFCSRKANRVSPSLLLLLPGSSSLFHLHPVPFACLILHAMNSRFLLAALAALLMLALSLTPAEARLREGECEGQTATHQQQQPRNRHINIACAVHAAASVRLLFSSSCCRALSLWVAVAADVCDCVLPLLYCFSLPSSHWRVEQESRITEGRGVCSQRHSQGMQELHGQG